MENTANFKNCYKVKDDGWGNGITFVEINLDKILHGDFYLRRELLRIEENQRVN